MILCVVCFRLCTLQYIPTRSPPIHPTPNTAILLAVTLSSAASSHRRLHNPLPPAPLLHRYLKVALTDFSSSANYIHAAFDDATKFIDECRAANSAVMVHCVAGISRSTTAVLQYLMKREGWSLKKAYAITKAARTNMRPNKVRRWG